MISAVIAFFTALPSVVNGFTAFSDKYFDTKVKMLAAKIGGDVEMAKGMLVAEVQNNQTKVGWLSVVAGSPILSFVVVGFAFPFIFYLNKVVVYDICLGLGSTPAMKYELLTNWGGIIISGIFVTTTGVGAVQAWVNRPK